MIFAWKDIQRLIAEDELRHISTLGIIFNTTKVEEKEKDPKANQEFLGSIVAGIYNSEIGQSQIKAE